MPPRVEFVELPSGGDWQRDTGGEDVPGRQELDDALEDYAFARTEVIQAYRQHQRFEHGRAFDEPENAWDARVEYGRAFDEFDQALNRVAAALPQFANSEIRASPEVADLQARVATAQQRIEEIRVDVPRDNFIPESQRLEPLSFAAAPDEPPGPEHDELSASRGTSIQGPPSQHSFDSSPQPAIPGQPPPAQPSLDSSPQPDIPAQARREQRRRGIADGFRSLGASLRRGIRSIRNIGRRFRSERLESPPPVPGHAAAAASESSMSTEPPQLPPLDLPVNSPRRAFNIRDSIPPLAPSSSDAPTLPDIRRHTALSMGGGAARPLSTDSGDIQFRRVSTWGVLGESTEREPAVSTHPPEPQERVRTVEEERPQRAQSPANASELHHRRSADSVSSLGGDTGIAPEHSFRRSADSVSNMGGDASIAPERSFRFSDDSFRSVGTDASFASELSYEEASIASGRGRPPSLQTLGGQRSAHAEDQAGPSTAQPREAERSRSRSRSESPASSDPEPQHRGSKARDTRLSQRSGRSRTPSR